MAFCTIGRLAYLWASPVEEVVSLSPPTSGSLKFNLDGSAKGKPGSTATGGVLRYSDGLV